ncbi:MAG: alpha/beta hydrolase [Sphingomonadaceae bacterium]|nr:alpha/beta hydrolase [Sphingomonadaceae bacterium]
MKIRFFTPLLAFLAAACSPPGMLSALDAASGGGRGVARIATAVPFGEHGQTLDVWSPDTPPGPHPVVIFFYGGGWVKGTRQDYAFAARAFASRGFTVVVPDYRKVPGVRFPVFLQDSADAVKWTRDNVARFGGDRGRIALAGHSAGAYAVAMLTLDKRWLTDAGVDPEIIKAAVGLCGPYDFYPFTGRAIAALGAWPRPRETQPIAFARADAPPMLLVTGTKDTTVRPKNAINLARALKALGAPVVLRNYEGLDHEDVAMALSKPFRSKGSVLADSVAFIDAALARHVSPPAKKGAMDRATGR